MRLRYDKNATSFLKENPDLVIMDISNKIGKWPKVRPLHLEIGMGKGQFIIKMAQNNPHYYFIGMEKERAVLKQAVKKLDQKLSNLIFILADAKALDGIFGENELDHIYLNFSDPWPKTRHAKRRLTSLDSLKQYQRLLKNKGFIEFKTDNRLLFTYSLQMFVEAGFKLVELSLDLHADNDDVITTEYEDRFVSEDKIIYYMKVQNEKNEII